MERREFLPCVFRTPDGRIGHTPFPESEPDPYGVPADLYAPSYEVRGGLLTAPKLGALEVTIFNTQTYRPDPELEEAAKTFLVESILRKEGPEIVDASGGSEALRRRIKTDTFWMEPR